MLLSPPQGVGKTPPYEVGKTPPWGVGKIQGLGRETMFSQLGKRSASQRFLERAGKFKAFWQLVQ